MAQKKSLFANFTAYSGESSIVETYCGKKVDRKECIFIVSSQKYALLNDPLVIKDYFTGKHEFIKNCSIIINKFSDDDIPIKEGCVYSRTIEKAVVLMYKNMQEFRVIYEAIPLNNYTEDYSTGYFYHNSIPKKDWYQQNVIYRKVKNADYCPTGDLKKDYLLGLKSPSYAITEGKRFKFGVEIETIYGRLPEYLDNYLNYNAVHDGSLRGPNGEDPIGAEYVTGVLTGDTGFLQVKRLCNEVTKRCKIDKKCGEVLATL